MRDRKNPPGVRHDRKSASTINTLPDEHSQQQSSSSAMRSLDRRHARAPPTNTSANSTTGKSQMKSSHTDIYGSL